MPMEIVGIDSTNKCEFCACTFCKKGPLGTQKCALKLMCVADGQCSRSVPEGTCPEFDPKF